jgi:hypothetical protein
MHRFGKKVCGSNLFSGDVHFLLDPKFLSFILTEKFVIDEWMKEVEDVQDLQNSCGGEMERGAGAVGGHQ